MKIYTGGTFDVFHRGHKNFLRQCAELGDVVVALNTDEFVKEFKGEAPAQTYILRERTLRACGYVHDVVKNLCGADSRPTIELVNPDIIAIGSDWARKDYYKQLNITQDWLDEKGISLIYIPYTHGISSTQLRNK